MSKDKKILLKRLLPLLWIFLRKILRSGISDVWLPSVATLLC